MYKLIALDIDGTLQNSKKEITEYTKSTIIKAQEKGAKVIISSGRPTYGILPIANKLELCRYGGYILAFNGSEIIEHNTGKKIVDVTMDTSFYSSLYQNAKQAGCEIMVYNNDHIVTEDDTNEYVRLSSSRNKMNIRQTPSFLNEVTYPVHKCLIVGDPNKIVPLENNLKSIHKDALTICRSEPFFLEITPPNINKAKSLATLLKHIGINSDEMMACGDAPNDIEMIKYAGMGVAMGNAHEKVKSIANYITLTNDEDGVAAAINKFVLNIS